MVLERLFNKTLDTRGENQRNLAVFESRWENNPQGKANAVATHGNGAIEAREPAVSKSWLQAGVIGKLFAFRDALAYELANNDD